MASIQWDQNTDFLDANIGTMDLNYELDENESNELLYMCVTAPLWTFQNKAKTENPETAGSLNANDSADLHVPDISTDGLSEVNNGKQMKNYKAPTFVDVEINE